MEIISTHTTSTSLVVPIKAYKRLNSFAILGVNCLIFVGPEHQSSKIYEYLTKRPSSQTNTWTTLMHSATMNIQQWTQPLRS